MREIKFRAWSAHHKAYADQAEVFHDGSWCFGFDDVSGVSYGFTPEDGDVLEQYTGLKDKSGVEIYEGDICRLHFDEICSHIPEDFCGSVVFMEGAFWVDSGLDAFPVFQEIAVWEIVGNIHENGELLSSST